jgi:hypothetical protein
MDGRCDAPIAAGLRDAPVVESGLSQASSGQVRLCSVLGLGARLSHRDRSRRYWASFSYIASRSVDAGSGGFPALLCSVDYINHVCGLPLSSSMLSPFLG